MRGTKVLHFYPELLGAFEFSDSQFLHDDVLCVFFLSVRIRVHVHPWPERVIKTIAIIELTESHHECISTIAEPYNLQRNPCGKAQIFRISKTSSLNGIIAAHPVKHTSKYEYKDVVSAYLQLYMNLSRIKSLASPISL